MSGKTTRRVRGRFLCRATRPVVGPSGHDGMVDLNWCGFAGDQAQHESRLMAIPSISEKIGRLGGSYQNPRAETISSPLNADAYLRLGP